MASGQDGGALHLSTPPAMDTPADAGEGTVLVVFHVVGAILIFAGTFGLATAIFDFSQGRGSRATLTAIGAAASFICGTLLVAQRPSSYPDTVRRSVGLLEMGIGPGVLAHSLQDIGVGGIGATDLATRLAVFGLVLGSLLVLIGAISLSSRRHAAWYRRKWDESERRRREKQPP